MNSGPPISNQQSFTTGNTVGGGLGRENPAQKGVNNLIKSLCISK